MSINLAAFYKRNFRVIPGIKSYVWASAVVFLLGLIITGLSWYVDRQRVDAINKSHLHEQAQAVEADIRARLNIYEQVLRGVSGLFYATDTVTNESMNRFIDQYDVQSNYPGISGIGYVEHVPASDLPLYFQRVQSEGYANAKLTPEGARSEYGLLTYMYPDSPTSRSYTGYDVLTDAVRSKLAKEARDSGKVNISERTQLLSDTLNKNGQAGFTMYVATYKKGHEIKTVEQRQQGLRGYVYAGYRANTLFNQAINRDNFTAYSDVQIFDGKTTDEKALLYQTADLKNKSPQTLSKNFEVTMFNRPWTIRFGNPVANNANDIQRSNMILVGGTTISFALAGFLFLVMLTRARAIVYAKQNEAQQAKDDLLSLASHQLRTPATAVKQYLGMILEGYTGKVNKKQLPAIQKAYASNERQLDTINQILYVAKADAGRLSINQNIFDIHLLIDEIALDLGDMLAENDQTISIERSNKKMNVYADEASMRMVIENLVSNASKYSYEGSGITIKTGTKDKEIFIAIIDEGVGINPDDFDKLFKKFSRIDNDLSLQVGGSGIGLYIDKVLVELHGGRIVVTSKPGQGSTFTIYLPQVNANNLTDGSG